MIDSKPTGSDRWGRVSDNPKPTGSDRWDRVSDTPKSHRSLPVGLDHVPIKTRSVTV